MELDNVPGRRMNRREFATVTTSGVAGSALGLASSVGNAAERDLKKVEEMIDLRSDVKTLPTVEMLEAMQRAELGDSKVDEDPTVLRLEAMASRLMGTESAVLVISGTMANLCALMAHANRGGAFLTDPDAHIYYYEGGHVGVAGLQPLLVESCDGLIDPDELAAAIKRYRNRASLLCLENTHNRGGGRAVPFDLHAKLCRIARDNGMAVHLDGARIFNAAVATGTPAAEYARHADSAMFCLSKSLSCPLGSVLCGSRDFIRKAKTARNRIGGGMRQAGVIAAAGIVALRTMIDRLSEDHVLARRLAEAVAEMPGLTLNLKTVETNMVNVGVEESGRPLDDWIQAFKKNGVLVGSHRPNKLRLVTHRHHDTDIIDEAIRRMGRAAETIGA